MSGDTHLLASSPQTGTGQGPQRIWIWTGMECTSQRPPTVPSPPSELSNHCLNGCAKQLGRQNGANMRKLSETHTLPERFCLRGFHGVRLETSYELMASEGTKVTDILLFSQLNSEK